MGPGGLGTSTSQKSLHQHNTEVILQGIAMSSTVFLESQQSLEEKVLMRQYWPVCQGHSHPEYFTKHSHKGGGCCPFPGHSFHVSEQCQEKLDGADWKSNGWCSQLCGGRSQPQEGMEEGWTRSWVTQRGKNSLGWCMGGSKAAALLFSEKNGQVRRKGCEWMWKVCCGICQGLRERSVSGWAVKKGVWT